MRKIVQQLIKVLKILYIPIIKNCKGFVRYYWLDDGNGEAASISIFASKAEGEATIAVAADYVNSHLKGLITQKPEIIEGLIVAHE